MALLETTALAQHFRLKASGKVRDVYELDESKLLFVATDRISAYDVNLANGVPHKGALLTLMSVHWFSVLTQAIPHLKTHFVTMELPAVIEKDAKLAPLFGNRSMQVRKLDVLPIESIVRGYITGSAWSEYKEKGTVHGLAMPSDLKESEKLSKPLWTPSTKAPEGEHDMNISPQKASEIIGEKYAKQVEALSLEIYSKARDYAAQRGIIIADTKFEFAVDRKDDSVVLVDEVLTPDSSRFWPAKEYRVGQAQPSLDKQYLRDWLTKNNLKGKPRVVMPEDVVKRTFDGYKQAFEGLVRIRWDIAVGEGENADIISSDEYQAQGRAGSAS